MEGLMTSYTIFTPKRLCGVLFSALAGLVSTSAWSATDIQVWYSLNAHNKKVFEQLVKDFNKQQKDIAVKTRAFDSQNDLDAALSLTAEKERPHVVQLPEVSGMDDVATRAYIQPLYQALNKTTAKNTKWFLPSENNFMHDAKGRLLALPFMAEIPVMYYNIDAFKKAGLTPTQPSRSWQDLQGQLVTLANNGSRRCPLTSDQPVSINLENLAAVNKQIYGPGVGKGKAGFNFDTMYIRHLSTMISWVRSEILVHPSQFVQSPTRFAEGECAVFMSNSGNIGQFADQRRLDFAVTGIPYYPQVTATPGSPFVTGSGLWLTKGHGAAADQASAEFLAWLAQPEPAATWFQKTGFLPLTQEAFANTGADYYKNLGDWRSLVAVYSQKPENTARGFKIKNYHQIRAMFNTTLESALEGKQPAMTALQSAAAEANKLINAK
ncbi:glycerol-3-phosphate ABC transporter substrate-binding protein [Paenalcaligenes hominis]|uniref:sn-glycerol-3-phosphate-binding periplasmic protein UgpB n=1 Tax=Paenalcaligenes hominis TaxID=643674 RepID=A0A1U9K2N6_9BURK|nr:glycerol-3-phosphate ABC transporter substrate-binding protein [Paenalcaligenes hominis]